MGRRPQFGASAHPRAPMFDLSRRHFLASTAASALVLGAPRLEPDPDRRVPPSGGRLKQSVARWCYGQIPLPDLCVAAKGMGLAGIDLLARDEWPIVSDHGLTCAMGYPYPKERDRFIATGFNDP